MHTRRTTFLAAFCLSVLMALPFATGAQADIRTEVITLYGRFVAAQNARDLDAVKTLLLDSPDFLWVSDGKSIWGRDALVERMGRFQTLEVWHVGPLLERARVIMVSDDVAYLHMPLDLHLGTKAAPSVTRFLVSILCRRSEDGWRIAALFTTLDNP